MKYGPEILMGVGIVGVVASTVMACKATLKVDATMKKSQEAIDHIHSGRNNFSELDYKKEDYTQDLAVTYVRRAMSVAGLYAPALAVGIAAIGCILGSHSILSKRNFALMAAYKLIDEGFKNYRGHVIEELGAGKDREYRYGKRQELTILEEAVDAAGNKVVVDKTVFDNGRQTEMYQVIFDENTSPQFKRDLTLNKYFLSAQQNYANNRLTANGYLFLNDVLESLGLPHTSAGQQVGWIKNSAKGDGFVDFEITPGYENDYSHLHPNRSPDYYLIDFNVDGVILDLFCNKG
jgi:Family of unknown function (DUF6353)